MPQLISLFPSSGGCGNRARTSRSVSATRSEKQQLRYVSVSLQSVPDLDPSVVANCPELCYVTGFRAAKREIEEEGVRSSPVRNGEECHRRS
mmetsp:Transcript_27263/g.106489  ORF Transcript_27263/g.106489 Transcript_27263/m.106489 type:complete len:92 (+) Transcript_27263:1594-1869(+)